MKNLVILIAVLLIGTSLNAQNIDKGKSFLYEGRTTSAKNAFDALIVSNPKDAAAIYWLGQTYLQMDDIKAAKSLYQKALNDGISDPLIVVGSGHIDLLEGRKDSAMQKFEMAIEHSKKRKKENPEILNAIGRANADGASTVGNPQYGVDVLKRSIAIDPKNPDTYINMGINYLKLGGDHGGDAYTAFNNALQVNPNYAEAKYRLGNIFLSQDNKDKFEGYYLGAIESDSFYTPAYLALYNYYSLRDVNKAKGYLESYMNNSDKDCNIDYFYGDYLFRAGKYQESLDKAKAMSNGQCKDYPRLKVLFAYDYDRLGNSDEAKQNIESYLNNAVPEKIQPADYMLAVSILKRIPGSEDSAIKYLKIALSHDTVRANQFNYMDTIAGLYKRTGNMDERLVWLKKSFATNPSPSNFDIYNLGDAAMLAGQYVYADSMFNIYKNKYPKEIYGYNGLAKSAMLKDKDTTTGSAVPAVNDYIKYLERTDSVKYKYIIIQDYGYLTYVHANVLKDLPAALVDLKGILAIDPENSYAKATAAQIDKILNPPPKPTAKSSSKASPKSKKKSH